MNHPRLLSAIAFLIVLFLCQPLDSLSQNTEIHPYIPGDVIIKLKDDSGVTMKKSGDAILSSDAALNEVLSKYQIEGGEALFPGFRHVNKSVTIQGGEDIPIPDLSKIHLLRLKDSRQTQRLIRELKHIESVEYAEPNYIYEACADPDDELYGDQWYIPACKIDKVWAQAGNTSNQIIGILDTGVDYEHPDLKDNMLQGRDFINNDNDPQDDNGHGTHVAGIAAASGNNGIGICGVNPNAKILPVKVLQSSGRGDAATIAQGIRWAADNGATVLNMSFGSYASSQSMADALAYAYSKAVLVAAAGNDGRGLGKKYQFYPAAYQYVLGVQATDQNDGLAEFSNRDSDGPIASIFDNLLNYEVKAPGTEIISTFPGNRYKSLQGTSMAAPVIAGAISLYKDINQSESQEIMWAKITQSNGSNVFDLEKTLAFNPEAKIQIVSHALVDTLNGDSDYQADAGERMEFNLKVRNVGSNTDKVWVKLQLSENEDQSVATINNDVVNIGGLGAYASRTNFNNPFEVIISNSVVNNRDIVFEALAWIEGAIDTTKKQLIVTCEKGIEISGLISEDQVWTNDNLYLIVETTLLPEGKKIRIEAGTEVLFTNSKTGLFYIEGELNISGSPGNLVILRDQNYRINNGPYISTRKNGKINIDYCFLDDVTVQTRDDDGGDPQLYVYNTSVYVDKPSSALYGIRRAKRIEKCNYSSPHLDEVAHFQYNNIKTTGVKHESPYGHISKFVKNAKYIDNNFIININRKNTISSGYYNADSIFISQNWWGGNFSKEKMDFLVSDWNDNFSGPFLIYEPILTQPSDSAHGIVWKVLVDGKYPDYEKIDAFGEGEHTFEVYFNRAMDKSVEPFLSFGVREPFTQHVPKTESSWSADGNIWTAKYYFDKYTGDGINYIRVADAQDDEYFKIPIEDSRFSFVIDAAGAASTIFTAEGGKGEVSLDWEPEPGESSIGYNIYRFENETDTTYTDTIRVNSTVVTEEGFSDKTVEPYKRYYYMYTSINEDFQESSYSKVASAVPEEGSAVEEYDAKHFAILSVYPNPVRNAGFMEAEIYQPGFYRIDIVDLYGNRISSEDKYLEFGRNVIEFSPGSEQSGMYFIRLGNGKYSQNRKFIFMR